MYLKLLVPEAFFQPKMHQIAFGVRAPPGPAGELKRSPRHPSRNKGAYTSKRGGEGGVGKGRGLVPPI